MPIPKIGDIVRIKEKFKHDYMSGTIGWLHGEEAIKPIKVNGINSWQGRLFVSGFVNPDGEDQAIWVEHLVGVRKKSKKQQLLDKIDYLWKKQDYYKERYNVEV